MPVSIVRGRSKHQLASGFSSSHGIAGDYSDRRTPRSASQDRPVKNNAPAICDSSVSGANVRSYLAFAGGTVRRERGLWATSAWSQPDA